MTAATPLTARPAARCVATLDTCPLCGGATVRREPLLDRVKKAGVPVVGGSIEMRKSGEEYFACNGCTSEFVYAERDIETVMSGLMVRPNVRDQIDHHYGKAVKVYDLLTRHRTAIIRKANPRRSLLGVSVAKNELIICFKYGGVRTFGSFVRERDPVRGYRYTFAELSIV